jgi:hypothetical protein
MNNEKFVEAIKEVIVKGAKEGVKSNITKPAGRQPQQKYIIMSSFYNKLSEHDKEMLQLVIKESVEAAIFGLLCAFDGVSVIDDYKGEYKLYYEKDGIQTLINDPDKEYLHDLFNAEE